MDTSWREEWDRAQARVEERRRALERAELQRRRNAELQEQCDELRRQHELELEDVEKLKGLGFQALLRTLVGDRKELLAKEGREAFEAKVRYHDACEEQQRRAAKLVELEAQAADLEGAEEELEALSMKREQQLRSAGGAHGQEVDTLLRRRDELRLEQQEIQEARLAGNDAGEGLDDVLEVLDSAARWGVFDMIGGGLIATAVKHSKLDEARRRLEEAGNSLWDFERELKDVGEISLPTIDLSQLDGFLDYFLDGILVDAFVQSRINRAREATRETAEQVEEIQRGLDGRYRELDAELERVGARLGELIEGSWL